ncbi:hypothetical protein Fmac_017703 [Flemingia macrophylla]|uniref:DUF1279 domain-containing protein n=1 Tax=Flemingia macrophylla TaxID=520843 RepID=A0ABD1M3B9_9FABA
MVSGVTTQLHNQKDVRVQTNYQCSPSLTQNPKPLTDRREAPPPPPPPQSITSSLLSHSHSHSPTENEKNSPTQHQPQFHKAIQGTTTMAGGRFRELMKKYGKVALGVHLGVSTASITGLYVAIRNNVDVEAILEKFHMGAVSDTENPNPNPNFDDQTAPPPKNRTAQLAASAGGAFTLAILCNKALFPIRVPITVALTPPIARFLARRNILKTGV